MRVKRWIVGVSTLAVSAVLATEPGLAQQINGKLGSPDATMSIEGNQLPPAPPKFGGVINEDATQSTPWWPPRVVPRRVHQISF